ncbi:MAG: hypothetical protein ACYDA8_06875 [Deferrisomatales bacterium]
MTGRFDSTSTLLDGPVRRPGFQTSPGSREKHMPDDLDLERRKFAAP